MLWLCYFPVDWGWLAWVALVPLLTLLRARETPRFLFLCAWLAGVFFFIPALWWMHAADGLRGALLSFGPMTAASLALALYCALYFPLALSLLRRLDRYTPLPLVVTVPVVWTALEFFRSFFGTGFPWYFLGHTQHDLLPLIQIADLGGAYLVSFLVVAVNVVVFEWLYACPWVRTHLALREPAGAFRLRRHVLHAACLAGLIVAALVYGGWRLGQNAFRIGPRLALVQGNVDQRLRNKANHDNDEVARTAKNQISRHFGELCVEAAKQWPRPDLIVWPETSFTANWIETSPNASKQILKEWDRNLRARKWYGLHEDARAKLREVANDSGTNLLLGLLTWEMTDLNDNPQKFNSALLVTSGGATGGRYNKIHRVPFGEYIPFKDWLPFMNALSPYDFDYSVRQGDKLTRFKLGAFNFGVLICYEDGYADIARQYGADGQDGRAADFLINISNDGWFDGTAEHEQHLAICRFRAIETRRSIARSVNMGISGIIDGNGRVLEPQPLRSFDPDIPLWDIPTHALPFPELPVSRWQEFKKVQGVLLASVPIDTRTSFYALWGDWFPIGCWLVIGTGLALAWWKWRRVGSPMLA
jgi:apolipoprotein N-acyltransferase